LSRQHTAVESLQIFEKKGAPGTAVAQVRAMAGAGLAGDRHADGGPKQISVTDAAAAVWMARQPEEGLCFPRYKANITVSFAGGRTFRPGDRFRAGSAVLEITDSRKLCFPECPRFPKREACLLRWSAWYARVVESGVIRTGDPVIFSEEEQ
jgi:MOSC domain-containing protein YiiM